MPDDNDSRRVVQERLRALHQKRLDENYAKACRRAEKKGRKLPPREQYYDHWGYSYYMYAPYYYPMYWSPGLYYGNPGYVPVGDGAWANCCQGSCGNNGVAAGACGGPGGCGNPGVSVPLRLRFACVCVLTGIRAVEPEMRALVVAAVVAAGAAVGLLLKV